MIDQQYLKGFNQGYQLKQGSPKIFEHVLNGVTGDSLYKNGLRDGGKQYDQERGKELLKERMGKDQDNDRDNTYDRDR